MVPEKSKEDLLRREEVLSYEAELVKGWYRWKGRVGQRPRTRRQLGSLDRRIRIVLFVGIPALTFLSSYRWLNDLFSFPKCSLINCSQYFTYYLPYNWD